MSSTTTTQTAAVLHGPRDLRLEQRTVWPPKHDEAQVEILSTGLCGSDLHYYLHGRNGDFALQAPLVLGHEAAGVVTAVGAGVRHLVPGQRVAIEAGIMCNQCNYCGSGRYNLCKGLRFCSSAKTFPHLDGTLQNRMNHPAHVLHPLPDNCTFEQAALAEPLSVLLHASSRADLQKGQSVLVLGVGAIGLLACAVASSLGASRVVAVDINDARLAFAKTEGFAQDTYCLPMGDRPKTADEGLARSKANAEAAMAHFKQPDGFDVVFECTGAEPCIQMAVHAAATGGKVMLVGMGARTVTLPIAAAATREVDIRGSFRYANTYPTALALLASGKLANVDKLVTHRFALERTPEAFELLARGKDESGRMVLKIMVGPGEAQAARR
ncbi:GroES-like protein [Punctularia strigosozonata HHB-11173 SS5]|uniref:GroES-like protein n=1 Tax=Punctularia strigosozonata (strain HHB-11173) TaxID=741275 RepID=UPI00044176C2|nr:GroES-like protein [Punctularia strigosozonata HHB-11173 SS5]EIN08313.1 GroES-like protein [Punctularia strigosozonata HHB-11173 SS5]